MVREKSLDEENMYVIEYEPQCLFHNHAFDHDKCSWDSETISTTQTINEIAVGVHSVEYYDMMRSLTF